MHQDPGNRELPHFQNIQGKVHASGRAEPRTNVDKCGLGVVMASGVESETRGRFAGWSSTVMIPWDGCFFTFGAAGAYDLNCVISGRREA